MCGSSNTVILDRMPPLSYSIFQLYGSNLSSDKQVIQGGSGPCLSRAQPLLVDILATFPLMSSGNRLIGLLG